METSLLFSENIQVLENKVEMMLLGHVAVELTFRVETNKQLKWSGSSGSSGKNKQMK